MNKKTVLYALLSVIVAIAYFLKNNKKEVSSNKLPAEISSTETKKDTKVRNPNCKRQVSAYFYYESVGHAPKFYIILS